MQGERPDTRFRLLVWGCESVLSFICLQRLLQEQRHVVALLLFDQAGDQEGHPWRLWQPAKREKRHLPVLQTVRMGSVRQLAHAAGIPVLEISNLRSPALQIQLATYRADISCVACFPRLIPTALRAVATLASINIHPSLLPCYRGPAPLYWILHNRCSVSGVTIHELGDRFDSGPILAQRSFQLANDMSYEELELLTSEQGVDVLLDVLDQFARGTVIRQPQDETQATYYGYPSDSISSDI